MVPKLMLFCFFFSDFLRPPILTAGTRPSLKMGLRRLSWKRIRSKEF